MLTPLAWIDILMSSIRNLQPFVRRGDFKAVRGEYGSGKTFFFSRAPGTRKAGKPHSARGAISATAPPLHRLATIFRRLMERLATADSDTGAFGSVIEGEPVSGPE